MTYPHDDTLVHREHLSNITTLELHFTPRSDLWAVAQFDSHNSEMIYRQTTVSYDSACDTLSQLIQESGESYKDAKSLLYKFRGAVRVQRPTDATGA